MGYQFSNNWPYTYTGFPTMVDHTDPVNNTYFTGLHTEVENIEDTLGLSPEGDYSTVKDRLDALGLPANFEIVNIKTAKATGDLSTTSTSFADVTNVTVTFTTGANKVLILAHLNGGLYKSGSPTIFAGFVKLLYDSTVLSGGTLRFGPPANTIRFHAGIPLFHFGSVSAGSHTFKIQWKVNEAGIEYGCATNTNPDEHSASITVIEVKDNT